MFCEHCGAELDRGQTYCGICGAMVQEYQPEQYAPAPSPASYSAPPQRNGAFVGLIIACTVLIMLLIGLGLVAGGVIKVNGSEEANVEKVASKQGTTTKSQKSTSKKASPETVVIKETPTKETSSKGSSEGSSSRKSNTGSNAQETYDEYYPPAYNEIPYEGPVEEPTSSAPSRTVTTGFVFPESSSRYLSEDELYGIDNWTLCIARNEIYARHGRGFVTEAIQDHFYECPWYSRTIEPEDFVEAEHFNDYEYRNALTIRDVERAQNSPYL